MGAQFALGQQGYTHKLWILLALGTEGPAIDSSLRQRTYPK